MYKTNSVCEKYLDSIIDREKIFPTGLKIGNINIAIPHTDHKYSNIEGIVLSTLKSPLIFKRMDDPDKDVSVDIIIHLFFNTGDKKVEVLPKILQMKFSEISGALKTNDVDLIVPTGKLGKDISGNIPVVSGMPFITGINEDKTINEIVEILSK